MMYYYDNSLHNFIVGNYEASFMDAYKIAFDNEGRAFKKIMVFPTTEQSAKYSEIRAKLVHAKGRNARLDDINKIKKVLFQETVNILSFLKLHFDSIQLMATSTIVKQEQISVKKPFNDS
jgi:hypothetical protein